MQVGLRRQEDGPAALRRDRVARAAHAADLAAGHPRAAARGPRRRATSTARTRRDQVAARRGPVAPPAQPRQRAAGPRRLDAGVELRTRARRDRRDVPRGGRGVRAPGATAASRSTSCRRPGRVGAGDPGAVARVARILIDNALRFSPAGEAIRVAAAYHGEQATSRSPTAGPACRWPSASSSSSASSAARAPAARAASASAWRSAASSRGGWAASWRSRPGPASAARASSCAADRDAAGLPPGAAAPDGPLGLTGLDEPLDEGERGVGDLAPAAVDRQRVAAAGDLDDLGHALVALLLLVATRWRSPTARCGPSRRR